MRGNAPCFCQRSLFHRPWQLCSCARIFLLLLHSFKSHVTCYSVSGNLRWWLSETKNPKWSLPSQKTGFPWSWRGRPSARQPAGTPSSSSWGLRPPRCCWRCPGPRGTSSRWWPSSSRTPAPHLCAESDQVLPPHFCCCCCCCVSQDTHMYWSCSWRADTRSTAEAAGKTGRSRRGSSWWWHCSREPQRSTPAGRRHNTHITHTRRNSFMRALLSVTKWCFSVLKNRQRQVQHLYVSLICDMEPKPSSW